MKNKKEVKKDQKRLRNKMKKWNLKLKRDQHHPLNKHYWREGHQTAFSCIVRVQFVSRNGQFVTLPVGFHAFPRAIGILLRVFQNLQFEDVETVVARVHVVRISEILDDVVHVDGCQHVGVEGGPFWDFFDEFKNLKVV